MQASNLLLAALLSAALPAMARQPQSASTDPQVSVPSARYDSVFSGYRPYQEPSIAPWRDVNDEVGRIGGHVGIMGGAAGHAGHHGTAKKPPAITPEGGQAPVRAAPKASGGTHSH